MKVINEKEFESLMASGKTVLVDFFATWCGPCRMLGPILEDVNAEADGRFEVVKIDVDESYNVAKNFGIMSVPTLILFQNGKQVEKIVGLRQKKDILEMVEQYL